MAKRSTNKEDVAKEKVQNLLKDSGILNKGKKVEVVDVVETATEKKGTDWLEKQVDALSAENEKLTATVESVKADYEKLHNEYMNLKSSPDNPMGIEELQRGIMTIFKDLENNFLGRNAQRVRYYDANIKKLLDKFVGTFKFLQKK